LYLINSVQVPDLKKELKTRNLATSGNKAELLERLVEALKTEEGKSKYSC